MRFDGLMRLAAALTVVATMAIHPTALAEGARDFSGAPYLHVALGLVNDESGLRLLVSPADGSTEPAEQAGRRSLSNGAAEERFFYFDVADSYMHGGLNAVVMTITYDDVGLTPIYLDYDSFDVVNPSSRAETVVKKRVVVAQRTNSGGVHTARVTLPDGRFANNQDGGADFRIGSPDELIVRNVSFMRSLERPELPIRVVLQGEEVTFDVPPTIENDRTLVPMRAIFTAAGVTDIQWDPEARKVTARSGKTTIALTIDSDVAMVSGKPWKLDQPAVIRGDRTLVPVRFVAEQLGLTVDWNPEYRLITLTAKSPTP